ncbi:MAG: Do family serine endopeptidase [Bacteroidota bacterium]
MNQLKKNLGVLLFALTGSIGGAAIYDHVFTSDAKTPISVRQPVKLTNYATGAMPLDFTAAAENTVKTVVHVTTTYENKGNANGNLFMDPFGGLFFGQPNQRQAPKQQASGSGVIISEDGYIVTNNHVVEDASEVEVTMDDKRTYTAKVIGADPSTDLALLKIEEKGLPFATYGNSDQVKVGEWVLAVGNPFNLTSTVTAGIVSAKARNIHILEDQNLPPIESFIQTDAAVNPGNSGGALVNTSGDLVGINAAIASSTGSYSGYSFAIPVNIVKKVVDDLLEYGAVQRGFIGVSIRDIDATFAKEKDIKQLDGVYVNGLTESGAASSAGLKQGDIITKINGTTVKSSPELQELVGRYRPGDKIAVTVLRGNDEKNFTVTLRNKEGNTDVTKNEADVVNSLGAELTQATSQEKSKLGIDGGVKIKELNTGKLRNAGLKEGFIITSIDNKKVGSVDDVTSYLQNKKGGVLIEGVYPNGMRAYYGFGM